MSPPPLVFLPGMGADHRLFAAQRRLFPHAIFPRWIAPRSGESLGKYAHRLAEQRELPTGCLLVGASFGGMLALEMASRLGSPAVALIGSARNAGEIRGLFRASAPLLRLPAIGNVMKGGAAAIAEPLFGPLSRSVRRTFLRMLGDTDPAMLQWAAGAILAWKPSAIAVPVARLHGSGDRLIAVPGGKNVVVIRGAGHLLTMTHPRAVNRFLLEWTARYSA